MQIGLLHTARRGAQFVPIGKPYEINSCHINELRNRSARRGAQFVEKYAHQT
jgi:hypothetical protein